MYSLKQKYHENQRFSHSTYCKLPAAYTPSDSIGFSGLFTIFDRSDDQKFLH